MKKLFRQNSTESENITLAMRLKSLVVLINLVAGFFLLPCRSFSVSSHSRKNGRIRTLRQSPSAVNLRDEISSVSTLFGAISPRGKTASKVIARLRAALVSTLMCLTFLFGFAGASHATTGGRMGGSFGRSSSSSRQSFSRSSTPSRNSSSSFSRTGLPLRSYHSPSRRAYPSRTIIVQPPFSRVYHQPTQLYYRNTPYQESHALAKTVIIAGVAGLVVWKSSQSSSWNNDGTTSALGPGTSVVSLTIALQVPNRTDRDNILSRITKLSKTANTRTRRGVQDLINNVSLELLRQSSSIHSAQSYSRHFRDENLAQRDFSRLSVEQRSKFEEETLNKYNEVDMSYVSSQVDETAGKATMAVVTINMFIEGNETKLPVVSTRPSVLQALQMIASDSQVDDCLLSAEILWSPQDINDRLTLDQVYSNYPELMPL